MRTKLKALGPGRKRLMYELVKNATETNQGLARINTDYGIARIFIDGGPALGRINRRWTQIKGLRRWESRINTDYWDYADDTSRLASICAICVIRENLRLR